MNIYIYIYICVCVCVCVYAYIYIYMYVQFLFFQIYLCRYVFFPFLYGYKASIRIYDYILICNWDCRDLCHIRAAFLLSFLSTFSIFSSISIAISLYTHKCIYIHIYKDGSDRYM